MRKSDFSRVNCRNECSKTYPGTRSFRQSIAIQLSSRGKIAKEWSSGIRYWPQSRESAWRAGRDRENSSVEYRYGYTLSQQCSPAGVLRLYQAAQSTQGHLQPRRREPRVCLHTERLWSQCHRSLHPGDAEHRPVLKNAYYSQFYENGLRTSPRF